MSGNNEVKIGKAKGRPMLSWVGKRPLRHVTAYPAQHIETFAAPDAGNFKQDKNIWEKWPKAYPQGGLLFHGDNKEVLAHLLANGFRGKVNLIYIDPPFDSGADYVRKVQLRGGAATAKIEGETYTLGEQIQYTDIWANDNYLQFMYERMQLLKELLAENGSIYLHCDWHKSYLLRSVLDEIFGSENCRNEIIWCYHRFGLGEQKNYTRAHDNILWYVKSETAAFNLDAVRIPYSDKTLSNFKGGIGGSGFGSGELNELGKVPEDFWEIAPAYKSLNEVLPYPTQKPEALIKKIILGSSKPSDIILDCFIGSGTTAAVAQKLGRRWIGCDINKGAIQTTSKRLQTIIDEQAIEVAKPKQRELIETEKPSPEPAQQSFSVWRVNDYDLKIQHNEAVQLACEHIGFDRKLSDSFFDGRLDKKLVKIIPFEHPLSPLDLEEVKKELEARPEEYSPIVLVCLGIELAAQTWIEEWNRLRKRKDKDHLEKPEVNKIEVIELRTDAKYGKFIKHEPAEAKVAIRREKDKIKVAVEDFISPTILKRLEMDTPLFKAKIADWRSQVDCVMIDTAYNGEAFNVSLSDIPEKKTDLINGKYELSAPAEKTTVAVKIIDMLGEEVLVTNLI